MPTDSLCLNVALRFHGVYVLHTRANVNDIREENAFASFT